MPPATIHDFPAPARRQHVQREEEPTARMFGDFMSIARAGGIADTYAPAVRLLNTFSRHPLMEGEFRRFRREVEQYGDRHILGSLRTASQFAVWRYVVGRTLGYAKLAERIPYKHMLNGHTSDDRRCSRGTGLCRAALTDALRGLEASELLDLREVRVRGVPHSYRAPVPVVLAMTVMAGRMLLGPLQHLPKKDRGEFARIAMKAVEGFDGSRPEKVDAGSLSDLLEPVDYDAAWDALKEAHSW